MPLRPRRDHHGPPPVGAPPGAETDSTTDSKEDSHVAVRLRLTRVGKKKQPTYRIVAADARAPRDGKYLEIVGTYDPRREPSAVTIDNEKAVNWLRKGAQPSERVEKLLKISGAWDEFQASKAAK